jgi:hypothetical protein
MGGGVWVMQPTAGPTSLEAQHDAVKTTAGDTDGDAETTDHTGLKTEPALEDGLHHPLHIIN